MVSKLRTHKRFSFSVRMKRSAMPFAVGRALKARGTLNPEEHDLLLEIGGQVVRPVVVTQPLPADAAPSLIPPKLFADTLADGLQGLLAVAALGSMQSDALCRAVIDGHEHAGRPLAHGHRGRHVDAAHHVGRLGGDRTVERRRPHAPGRTRCRAPEVVRTH